MSCVFCRIVEGDLPSARVWEDEQVVAFLDIAPINPGHTLIIPRSHHASVTTVPPEILGRMMQVAPVIGKALMRELDGDGFNLHLANGACAGQIVPHAHLHVIPRHVTDGFSWGWRSRAYESDAAKQSLATALQQRLGGTCGHD